MHRRERPNAVNVSIVQEQHIGGPFLLQPPMDVVSPFYSHYNGHISQGKVKEC